MLVDHDAFHAQRVGNQTGMLSACATEAGEGIARDVAPAPDADTLDRIRHIGDGNVDQATCGILCNA